MKLIGEILTEQCGLSEKTLALALQKQSEKGGRIGEILLGDSSVFEKDLLKALSIQFNIPYLFEFSAEGLHTGFTSRISIQFLKKYKMIPAVSSDDAFIAINDPLEFQALDDIRLVLDMPFERAVLVPESRIMSAINLVYDLSSDSAEQVVQDMSDENADSILSEIEETEDLLEDTSDAPIIKLVNLVLSQAVKDRASDIHIEPSKDKLKIRYRVDGILYDKLSPPKHIQAAFISRIKIMAGLNIAEKRLPQDGRIAIKTADRNIDIRVSTLPIAFGERVVMRLLDKTSILLKISDLGLPDKSFRQFEDLIKTPHGIILVTGPTGSGKTTTLYGALSTINNTDINIITIEDPVEYQVDGIGQIQVNPKIGLTFANGLRSIVRQDPDVILLGEIRDLETAEIAIQSALTGHLVFSTLHTNDAASAVTRLIDMGIEPFLITSSVIAILAQRLVRVLCRHCREEHTPDPETLKKIGIDPETVRDIKIYQSTGCPACLNTGYNGRIGIFELMILDEEVKNTILKTSDANLIKKIAIQNGMTTLLQDGAQKVLEGVTSIAEVFRITH